MSGALGFGQFEAHAVGDQHVEHPPQQLRPAAGLKITIMWWDDSGRASLQVI